MATEGLGNNIPGLCFWVGRVYRNRVEIARVQPSLTTVTISSNDNALVGAVIQEEEEH